MFKRKHFALDNSPASFGNKKIKLINILDYKIGYFPIPKTACTSIKHLLHVVEQGTRFLEESGGSAGIHGYFNKKRRARKFCRFEFSFVVVRDPIKRFLSAYSNRVTHHKELSRQFITSESPEFVDQLPYFDPSLGQFIDGFFQYLQIRPIKHHIQPVSHSLTKTNLQQFSKIYCMENLPALEYDLSAIHGHDLKLGRLQTGGRKIPLRDLSQQQMEFLLDYYQEDYELLSDFYTVEKIWEEWAGDSKCTPVIRDTPLQRGSSERPRFRQLMLPTRKNKVICIHTPKCAGTSIAKHCEKYDILIDTVNRSWDGGFSSQNEYANYFKFSFVRNPWDRMVSNYSMFNGSRKYSWWKDMEFADFLRMSFDCEFINQIDIKANWKREFKTKQEKMEIELEHKHSIQNHAAPYMDPFSQLFNAHGDQIVDFIGRFENLQEDFHTVSDKIGIPRVELPYLNKSKHKHYTEYYNDETRLIVAEKYAKDIEHFGYEFGK